MAADVEVRLRAAASSTAAVCDAAVTNLPVLFA